MSSLAWILFRTQARSWRLWGMAALGLFVTWLGATLDILGFDDPAEHLLETGIGSAWLASVCFVGLAVSGSGGIDAWVLEDQSIAASRAGPDGVWWAEVTSAVGGGVWVGAISLLLTTVLYTLMAKAPPAASALAWGTVRLTSSCLLLAAWGSAARCWFGSLAAVFVGVGVLTAAALPLPGAWHALTPAAASASPIALGSAPPVALVVVALWLLGRAAPPRTETD